MELALSLALFPVLSRPLRLQHVHATANTSNVITTLVNLDEDLIRQFETENDATVRLLPKGDAGSMLTSLILTKGDPEGDVAFGVDNTLLSRALDEGVFASYSSPLLSKVPNQFQADGGNFVTPIDYGFVNFNYDIAALEDLGVEAPTRLEDLTGPKYRDLVVVSNPASSSPGLAFLIATIELRRVRLPGLVRACGRTAPSGRRWLGDGVLHELHALGRIAADRPELRDQPGIRTTLRGPAAR